VTPNGDYFPRLRKKRPKSFYAKPANKRRCLRTLQKHCSKFFAKTSNHTGTKHGCELGEWAALRCAAKMQTCSLLLLLASKQRKRVLTVEGLGMNGALHPLQEAFAIWAPHNVATALRHPGHRKALSTKTRIPLAIKIREALSGNLCRCTGYLQIFEAVEAAVLEISGQNKAAT